MTGLSPTGVCPTIFVPPKVPVSRRHAVSPQNVVGGTTENE